MEMEKTRRVIHVSKRHSYASTLFVPAHRGPRYRRRADEIYDEADFRKSASRPAQRYRKVVPFFGILEGHALGCSFVARNAGRNVPIQHSWLLTPLNSLLVLCLHSPTFHRSPISRSLREKGRFRGIQYVASHTPFQPFHLNRRTLNLRSQTISLVCNTRSFLGEGEGEEEKEVLQLGLVHLSRKPLIIPQSPVSHWQ